MFLVTMSSSRTSSFVASLAAAVAAGAIGFLVYQKMIAQNESKAESRDPVARVYTTKEEVAEELCAFIVDEAKKAISERGVFHLAVAGGSQLDLLSQLDSTENKKAVDWSKVVLSFANHECVATTSEKATLAECKSKFADAIGITRFVSPMTQPGSGSGSDGDGSSEATFYAKALIAADIPHHAQYPIMDLVLLGLGADGHVGSCHPMGPAVLNAKQEAVAGSPKRGEPSSITLTIQSMNKARQLCVIVCGGSSGKKEAVKRAMERPAYGPRGSFPAQLLDGPIFFLDSQAAADL